MLDALFQVHGGRACPSRNGEAGQFSNSWHGIRHIFDIGLHARLSLGRRAELYSNLIYVVTFCLFLLTKGDN